MSDMVWQKTGYRSYAEWRRDGSPAPESDPNVTDVRRMLLERSEVGLKKYGCTTDRPDLSLRDWLQHALEEALDKAVYLRAAIRKLDEKASGA